MSVKDIYNEAFLTDILERVASEHHEATSRPIREMVDESVPAWGDLNAMQKQVYKQQLLPIVLTVLKAEQDIEAQRRATALEHGDYAVHFGVYPEGERPMVDGHTSRTEEHVIELPDVMARDGVSAAFVSGSWGCWGPADQSVYDAAGRVLEQSEGDLSLHVVFYTDRITPQRLADLRGVISDLLPDTQGRILDHAVISDREDWSQQTHLATFGGNPYVCVQETSLAASGGVSREGFEDDDA